MRNYLSKKMQNARKRTSGVRKYLSQNLASHNLRRRDPGRKIVTSAVTSTVQASTSAVQALYKRGHCGLVQAVVQGCEKRAVRSEGPLRTTIFYSMQHSTTTTTTTTAIATTTTTTTATTNYY